MKVRHLVFTEEDWLDLRKQVITATEMACVLGPHKYRSANQMVNDKHYSTFKGNSYTVTGQILEPAVVNAVNYILGTKFQLFETVEFEKVFFIEDEFKIGATPDAASFTGKLIEDPPALDGDMPVRFEIDKLLECKTCKPLNAIKYSYHPPEYYVVQLMTQLYVTGLKTGYLAIMSTDLSPKSEEINLPISIFEVTLDDRIVEYMESEATRFWKCQDSGKSFRVDSKVKTRVRLLLPTLYKKIY